MYIMQGIPVTHQVSMTSGRIRPLEQWHRRPSEKWEPTACISDSTHRCLTWQQSSDPWNEYQGEWAPSNNSKQASAGKVSINKQQKLQQQWQRNKWGQRISTKSPHQHTTATIHNLRNENIDSQHMQASSMQHSQGCWPKQNHHNKQSQINYLQMAQQHQQKDNCGQDYQQNYSSSWYQQPTHQQQFADKWASMPTALRHGCKPIEGSQSQFGQEASGTSPNSLSHL